MNVWAPYPGSQTLALTCPAYELLYHGTRGPGKTDVLLMDFLREVGKGYGSAWKGVIFRRTYPELEEVMARSRKWFHRVAPAAKFNEGKSTWVFPGGERLMFRFAMRAADYWSYHGWEVPWVGFDELTTWPNPEPFESLLSICRTSTPGVPRRVRCTSNPYGPGHSWVKARYIDHRPAGAITGEPGRERAHIYGHYLENRALIENSPEYIAGLLSIRDEGKRKAWAGGEWDIMAGGYFASDWDERLHIIPHQEPPPGSTFRAAFDWGYEKPAYLAMGAIVPGMTLPDGRQLPPGSLYLFDEWYTCELSKMGSRVPNKGLRLSNKQLGEGVAKKLATRPFSGNVADPSIFPAKGSDVSVYAEMQSGAGGVLNMQPAVNARVAGWGILRDLLLEAKKARPESPCLVVSDRCVDFIRTFPTLMTDANRPDDLDSDGEDHPADAVRYLAQTLRKPKAGTINIIGV